MPTTQPIQPPPKAATGVQGLDDVLNGGLPRGRIYLVEGDPGVGKTTLALQFLLAGAGEGERCLYVTLSETEAELRASAASHGWSLDGLTIFALTPPEDEAGDDQYTLLHPAEVELGEVMHSLLAEVDRVCPTRLVLDSLSEVRLLAQHPLRYRRQILSLKQRLAGGACTTLLLDDRTDPNDHQLKSLAHGVVTLENVAPAYGATRRRLVVDKLRGVRFREGYHDFVLMTGGLRVFPRLVAAEHHEGFEAGEASSGVRELDALLGGGLARGTSTLLIGPAGSGKSSVAMQFAAAACARGERAVLFVFDENAATLRARAEGLGMRYAEYRERGLLGVTQVDPAEMAPGEFIHGVREEVELRRARLVVVDSLNGYLQAMPGEAFLLNQLHELFTYLGQRGVVTLFVAAQAGLLGPAMSAPVDVSYLADCVMLFRYFESAGRVRKAVSAVKKRTGRHENAIREFELGPGGLRVGAPLDAFRGVLTGVPVYEGAAGPLLPADGDAPGP
ncbi:MAG TPA: ATPase domain-containing protein [Polyangiaceae bacterium]|nr:ATPase domain-containing protein [Polyangiaceae bacterium]